MVILLHVLHPAICTCFGLGDYKDADDGLAAADEARWKYFLGNTLFKLLDLAGLPRFGGSGASWPLTRYHHI